MRQFRYFGDGRFRAVATWTARLLPLLAAAWFSVAAAYADSGVYTLDTGDVVQVAVFGEQNYPIEMTVDDSGAISIPLVGDVAVRGKTTAAVKQDVENLLRDKDLIINPFVQISIRQYRPFFISGAVDKPGAYSYQPNMTVRHAIAIAGGFRAMQTDTEPALTISNLHGDQDDLGIEIVRLQVHLAALQAELEGRSDFEVPKAPPVPIDASLIAEIVQSERDQLTSRLADLGADLAHDEDALSRATGNMAALDVVRGDREQQFGFQNQQLVTARALHDKGLTAQSNVITAEQSHSAFHEALSQVELQQADAKQRVSDIELEIDKQKEAHKMRVLSDIQGVQIGLGKAESQLKHVTDKLTFMSLYGGTRSIDELGSSIRITIHRRNETPDIIQASENTDIRAGDLIEITVVPNASASADP